MSGKLCFLNCHNFQHEIEAAIIAEGWDDVMAMAYPARCGRPPVSWEELRSRLPEGCSQVIVLGRACLHDLKDPPSDFPPTRLLHFEQCFHLIAGADLVAEAITQGGYLVTPGWLEDWQSHIAEMGFTPKNAKEFFHDFARELVLLDTGILPESRAKLAEMAATVDLPTSRIAVGLDHTRLFLTKLVGEWRMDEERRQAQAQIHSNTRQIADHIMAMELLTQLSRSVKEEDIICAIETFFRMLFAPEELDYLCVKNGVPSSDNHVPLAYREQLLSLTDDYAWTSSGQGFLLRIAHDGQLLGLIRVERLALPAYREHYLNLALAMTGICGLAIANARNRHKLIEAEKMASLSFLVAGVAHGINTPLGVCLTAASTLQRDSVKLSEQFAERSMTQSNLVNYLETAQSTSRLIDSNLSRIGRLIDTFRQVAVYGKQTPKSRFKLKTCLDDVLRSLSNNLLQNHIEIHAQCDDCLEIESQLDDWNSIFVNLISNSLRHGFKDREQGLIDIKIEAGPHELKLDYVDNGHGIAPAVLARIFDPFFTTDLQHGMGLGMHLVYNLITHRLGGSIDCTSDLGKGVHFHIRIPL